MASNFKQLRARAKEMVKLKSDVLRRYDQLEAPCRMHDQHGNMSLVSRSLDPERRWRVTYFSGSLINGHSEFLSYQAAFSSAVENGFLPLDRSFPEIEKDEADCDSVEPSV